MEEELTDPEDACSPDEAELELLLEVDEAEEDEVLLDDELLELELLPGIVAALTYASVPTPAVAARATAAVRRFIKRWAASRDEIRK